MFLPTSASRHHLTPDPIPSNPRPSESSSSHLLPPDDTHLLDLTWHIHPSPTIHFAHTKLRAEEWHAYQQIPSDLSLSDFQTQARANSFAGSRAMRNPPSSVLYPSRDPLANVPTNSKAIDQYAGPTLVLGRPLPLIPNLQYAHPLARPDNEAAWERAENPMIHPHRSSTVPKPEYSATRTPAQAPALGFRSKKDKLGGVTASWGPLPPAGERAYAGVFQPDDEISRSDEEEEERPTWAEIRSAKYEAIGRATKGTRRPEV